MPTFYILFKNSVLEFFDDFAVVYLIQTGAIVLQAK